MTNVDHSRTASQDSPAEVAVEGYLLTVESPAGLRGLRLSVQPEGSVLGRDAELVVPHATVSRRHARAWWHDGSLWLEDCGSQNGTLVNGRRVESAVRLRDGDVATLGSVQCRLVADGPGVAAWPPAGGPEAVRSTTPTQSMASAETETTRYLCAAAHLDATFCDRVIRHTVDQSYRAIAPSSGVDVLAVARHALAARRRRFTRDVVLLVLLIGWIAAIAVQLADVWKLGVLNAADSTSLRMLVSTVLPSLLVLGGLAVLVVGVEAWVTRFLVLSRTLSHRCSRPHVVRGPWGRRARQRLDRVAANEHGNVTIFRGFHPFIGSGEPVNVWSFAVDISKGRQDPETHERLRPKEFDAAELHGYLSDALHDLAMPGLGISERLFVNGGDVWQDRRLLPRRTGPPATSVPLAMVREMVRENDPIGRPYLCAEATGWHGQLVQTTFLRAVKLRASLYIEGLAYVLLPLRSQFYKVDSLVPCGPFEAAAAALGHATVRWVPSLLASPARVAHAIGAMNRTNRMEERQRRNINHGWHFDFGATTSIRELAAGTNTRRYFLESDENMFETVVQERLLRGVVDFLQDHDVDVADAKNFQKIINNGNVFNGNVNFGNSKNASISGAATNKTTSSSVMGSPAR